MFSNNALFHGLAVFIDTYSNDDATDVSGGSGFTRQHVVSVDFCSPCQHVNGDTPTEFVLLLFHIFVLKQETKVNSITQRTEHAASLAVTVLTL